MNGQRWTQTLVVQGIGRDGQAVPVAAGVLSTESGLLAGMWMDSSEAAVRLPLDSALQLIVNLRNVVTAVMYDRGMTGGESI